MSNAGFSLVAAKMLQSGCQGSWSEILSCRSGGDLGGSSLGLEYLVSGWGELLEAAEFVQVCSEVLAVPTGPVHPSRNRREN